MLVIQFPEKWTPGYTDNFVSNEVIVKDLDFTKVLDGLLDAAKWETYYDNSSDIFMYPKTCGRSGTYFASSPR